MELDPSERQAVGAYAAGYLHGLMAQAQGITKVLPMHDDAQVVTGEIQFVFAGWECSLGVEAHRPVEANR